MNPAIGQRLVVHVVNRFAVGGLENGVVNLINRMSPERWRHAVISLTDIAETFAARVERKDTLFHALHKPPGHLLRLYPRLYRLLRELRPAVVHTRNLAALEACVPAWAAAIPARIHSEHGWDVHDLGGSRKYARVRRLYRPFVHRYIALSRDLERYLHSQVGVPGDRIEQIYNGVDTVRFHPAHGGSRTPISGCPFTAPEDWLVGTVGRMEGVKDPLNLARAFVRTLEMAPQARRNLRLVMVGDGSLRPAVQQTLAAAGVAGLAWLPGERSDVADIMRGLDCFVLPSLAEGISNTILEAMASGLPVVATRVGGNAELVEDNLTGRLVVPGDPDGLAFAILQYHLRPSTAKAHGREGRIAAETRFALARMAASYEAVYDACLTGRSPIVPKDGKPLKHKASGI